MLPKTKKNYLCHWFSNTFMKLQKFGESDLKSFVNLNLGA